MIMNVATTATMAIMMCKSAAKSIPPQLLFESDVSAWPESALYRTTVLEPKCRDLLSDYGKRFARHLL